MLAVVGRSARARAVERRAEVVLGYDAERVIPFVAADNVEPIVNVAWQADAASSLRAGASAVVRGTDTAIIVDVAEPRDTDTLRALLQAHAKGSAGVTVPSLDGERGTPIVAGERALAAVRNARGAGVASIVARFADEVQELPVDSPVVLARIDSIESYERVRSMLVG
jgi:CTP:molybdopterin cytidylyltransferase MocA